MNALHDHHQRENENEMCGYCLRPAHCITNLLDHHTHTALCIVHRHIFLGGIPKAENKQPDNQPYQGDNNHAQKSQRRDS